MEEVRNIALSLLKDTWPMILMSVIIISSVRLFYLIINKKHFILYQELLTLCFIIYIMALFQIVTFQDVSWSGNNFTLFKEISRYEVGSYLFFKNVFGNLLLFVPFGLFISTYLKPKSGWPILILSVIASISIEVIQLIIGRVFDVDDILLNVIGGMCGYIIYYMFKSISSKMPKIFKSEMFLNILVILIILIGGGIVFLW